MEIHELNTKALTDPAYVPFDDGTDTYKAEFNEVVENAANAAVAEADLTNNPVAFTSGDAASPTAWTNVSTITSGSTLATLFNRLSTMAKNVRYLKTQTDAINDKTTGAITLSSNVTTTSSFSCICEKRGNFVTVYIAFTATEDISTGTQVATIPSGFRPPRQFRFIVYKTGGTGTLQINSSGTVNAIGAISNTNTVLGMVSYTL